MKGKLIKLSEKHYIIVDGSEIKEDNIILWLKNKIWQNFQKSKNGYYLQMGTSQFRPIGEFEKITHSTQPLEILAIRFRKPNPDREVKGFDKIKELKLSEIEELIYGYSVEKMALSKAVDIQSETVLSSDLEFQSYIEGYTEGFKSHQDVKDKINMSIKELKSSLKTALYHGSCRTESDRNEEVINEIIQTLIPKKEWDIEINEQGKITLI